MTIDRDRLGKLFGAAGSAHEHERLAALRAIDASLAANCVSWAWVVDVIAHGAAPTEARERLYDQLVRNKLCEAYALSHSLTTRERLILGQVNVALDAGALVRDLEIDDVVSAVEIADEVRRRDRPSPARVNWR
jgi:hypothetical protein